MFNCRLEGPFWRIRNRRRLTVAPAAIRGHTHRTHVYCHCRPSYRGYIGGPCGVLAGLRASFCEYAIEGALQSHPPLLVITHVEHTYTVTVDQATEAILEALCVNSPVRGIFLANAQ